MNIFESIQDALGGVADSAMGTVEETVSGIADNQVVQDVQEQASTLTEGAADIATSATEQGQAVIDDITQNFTI